MQALETKKARLFLSGLLSISGADTKSRTRDLLITSQLLYQLSYVGTNGAHIMGDMAFRQALIESIY